MKSIHNNDNDDEKKKPQTNSRKNYLRKNVEKFIYFLKLFDVFKFLFTWNSIENVFFLVLFEVV